MFNQIKRKELVCVAIAVLLAAGLACSSFGVSSLPEEPSGGQAGEEPDVRPTWPPTWTPTSPPVSSTLAVEPTGTVLPVATMPISPTADSPLSAEDLMKPSFGGISCEGMDDLIEASRDCSLASATCTSSMGLFGLVITSTTAYEIRGMEADSCVLYMQQGELEVRMSDELVQKLLEDGVSIEEIRQQEQEGNEMSDLVEGREGVCRFSSTEDLTAVLSRWSKGEIHVDTSCELTDAGWECTSEGDLSVAECEGEYFSNTLE